MGATITRWWLFTACIVFSLVPSHSFRIALRGNFAIDNVTIEFEPSGQEVDTLTANMGILRQMKESVWIPEKYHGKDGPSFKVLEQGAGWELRNYSPSASFSHCEMPQRSVRRNEISLTWNLSQRPPFPSCTHGRVQENLACRTGAFAHQGLPSIHRCLGKHFY
jgi:hypothetical protein